MAVKTPFNSPNYYNQTLLNQVSGMSENTKGNYSKNKGNAQAGTDSVGERAKNTSGESLFSDQNANIAKTGGKHGTINDKDYSTTLKLMREADAYNSMPVGQIFKNGTRNTGGTQSLGYGFDKPNLETMETRTMGQAMGLDTQRKQAEIQLQAAIDAKDYDAFKAIIQQQLGIELSDFQAKNALDQFTLQMSMQDVLAKNIEEFKKEYARYFDSDTAATLYNLAIDNEPFAMQLGAVLENQVTPTARADQFAESYIQAALSKAASMGPYDKTSVLRNAILDLEKLGIKYDVETKNATKVRNGTFANLFAWGRQASEALPEITNSPTSKADK